MTGNSFAVFETAIGCCAIVWSGRGVTGVQLPDASEAATRARVLRRFPAASEALPPPDMQRAIEGIVALLQGEPRDLNDVIIDNEETPEFNARVYAIARTIPPGQTLTYGEIAERLGDKLLAREVGTALGQNPCPIIMPCHRVLAAGGKTASYKTGGFSAPGGVVTKLRLLSIEGAQPGGPTLFEKLPLVVRKRG
jgi:methylated-DNA-[protein]-cysteine S-methyltransferase